MSQRSIPNKLDNLSDIRWIYGGEAMSRDTMAVHFL
jgi:hypothetical protein